MIDELEMAGPEPGPDDRADVLDGGGGRSGAAAGALRRRPLAWGVVGGIVAASAVWAAALQATGRDHSAAPDLHGLRLTGPPCTSVNLEPLTDLVAPTSAVLDSAAVHHGPALDHADCGFVTAVPKSDGTQAVYAVSVTVDLHKKADPRAEFVDTYASRPVQSGVRQAEQYSFALPTDAVTRPYPGLGDLAYLSTDLTHVSLAVLDGGAVVSVTVDYGVATPSGGPSAATGSGWVGPPTPADVHALSPLVPRTVRHLMGALARR
ncbi:hypothetical protein V2S66_06945 [Streptomyces sp. V4-01]|uniref:DUF5642 domain-containing protein n=1 Tax=Actinacidiphila polyblastidii TaxID=3110430 RepID=A0ABU7P8W0_9ACTN|nr:hypothetical protein [Streptomyces sp. V4-01]